MLLFAPMAPVGEVVAPAPQPTPTTSPITLADLVKLAAAIDGLMGIQAFDYRHGNGHCLGGNPKLGPLLDLTVTNDAYSIYGNEGFWSGALLSRAASRQMQLS